MIILTMLGAVVVEGHRADDRVEVDVFVAVLDIVLELAGEELYGHRELLVTADVLEGELKRSWFHF